jgi:hypothetical protein
VNGLSLGAPGTGMAKSAQELLVALEARRPDLRALLVSAVQCGGAPLLAQALVHTTRAGGRRDISLVSAFGNKAETVRTDNGIGAGEALSIPFDGIETPVHVSRLQGFVKEASRDRMLVFSTLDFTTCPESSAVAAAVDGVVLVVEAQRTTRTALSEVRHRLSSLHACLIGFVYADRRLA